MKTLFHSLLALATLITLNSCTDINETVAPQAPATQVQSVAQTASDWTAVDNWTKDAGETSLSYKNFTDVGITNEVVEEGMVMVFYRNAHTKQVLGTLPAKVDDVNIGFTYHANTGKGNLNLYQESTQASAQSVTGLEYRWVIISKDKMGQLNWTNYFTVQQALKLQD